MTSQSRAHELTQLNIHTIFGEKNVPQRLINIAQLWVPSGEAFFVDSLGVFKTHDAISGMVDQILALAEPDDRFFELGAVETLKHDDEGDVWVTRVKWGVGRWRDDVDSTGWDVVTIVKGKIKACYTFLDGKQQ